jgi:hypothetical protein
VTSEPVFVAIPRKDAACCSEALFTVQALFFDIGKNWRPWEMKVLLLRFVNGLVSRSLQHLILF